MQAQAKRQKEAQVAFGSSETKKKKTEERKILKQRVEDGTFCFCTNLEEKPRKAWEKRGVARGPFQCPTNQRSKSLSQS